MPPPDPTHESESPHARFRPVHILPPGSPIVYGAPGSGPRRSRALTRRMGLAFGLLGVVLAGAGVFLALSLSKEPPPWWRPIDPHDPKALASARSLENGIATLLTKVRGAGGGTPPGAGAGAAPAGEYWTVLLKGSDANAWLATRLRLWLENEAEPRFHWPEALTSVQVQFEDGVIYIGTSIGPAEPEPGHDPAGPPARQQVLTAALVPEFRDDGSFWMPAHRLSVGRLSLPAGWMLRSSGPAGVGNMPEDLARLPQTRDVLAAFAGRIAVMRTPIVKIGDGRRVRLVALEARDGNLLITCQSMPRDNARAER